MRWRHYLKNFLGHFPVGPWMPWLKLCLQTATSALLVYNIVHANETINLERVNSPLQTCLCHFGKTIVLNAILYRKLGPLKLGPRNQIKTFKHVVYVCVCVCVYKKTSPLQWKPTKQTKKPVSVYLLSDFTANQKLHRIYFVQGKKPFKYLEYNS